MSKKNILSESEIAYKTTDDSGIFHIIQAVRDGIDYNNFKKVVSKIPFNIEDWSYLLHLSLRTMQRYKKENQTFTPVHTEKILEITMLFNLGKEILGNEQKFNTWLETKNIAMGGIIPKDLLDNSFGINFIKDELLRIEHGVLA